jgi:L-lactate dehydrogenase
VGATIAYTLAQRNIPADITLFDINQTLCNGQILDICDALPFCKTSTVRMGTYDDAKQSDIVVIAAGKRQEINQKRSELLDTNKKIVNEIINNISPLKKDAILIMVTNPVDVLTHQALKQSNLSQSQVFGSGTILDSMRSRELIAGHLGISPRSVNSFILGEHGDTQFPAWSISSIAGIPILEYPNLDRALLAALFMQARDLVYQIIKCKGSTYYGVASCVASMCENILYDQKAIVPLSCYISRYDTCLSVPCVLGKNGIEQQVPLHLPSDEQELLEKTALTIKALGS